MGSAVLFEVWKRYLGESKKENWNSAHAVLIDGSKILLVQRAHNDHWKPGKWAFPGGLKDDGESLEETLKREIKEEVDLDVELENLHYLPEISFKTKHAFYVCDKCSGTVKINANGVHEHEDYKWVEEKDISKLDTAPDVLQVVREALKLRGQ